VLVIGYILITLTRENRQLWVVVEPYLRNCLLVLAYFKVMNHKFNSPVQA
jgi:hypothetical protein